MSDSAFINVILSDDPEIRNTSVESLCQDLSAQALLVEVARLEAFRLETDNLYHAVRALFFLYAIYRFHLPLRETCAPVQETPYEAVAKLRERRFEEAIECLKDQQAAQGPSAPIASGLASAYHGLGFQKLSDQVRRSVRAVRGNQWMFRVGHPFDHPLRLVPQLSQLDAEHGKFPILRECTPVRMDLCHSAWSDIFFLGMDFPEGARVINASINLGVLDRDQTPRPPVEAYFRVIDEPCLRLTSVDLNATATISSLGEVFDFARDYLGLLKAAVIASGLIPPGIEGSGQNLAQILERIVGPNRGIELVSSVNDIPKGSRLAVSTNLLGALIAVCMRATGQIVNLVGPLSESERRIVAARAILGEWLGGSGGGWQDSGGVWPGIKLIQGTSPTEDDPEYGISRGCLLPRHTILDAETIPPAARERLQSSLVLVHGGMAQNVGPILEMVTEKYLLRLGAEWEAREQANRILDRVVDAMKRSDITDLAKATTDNFFGPIQTIIPWATNHYTESIINRTRERFGEAFWGFCMLGGMAGGGMAFFFDPAEQKAGQRFLQATMKELKDHLAQALPFAMDPLVYEFTINDDGSTSSLLEGRDGLMPKRYYDLMIPSLIRQENRSLSRGSRSELQAFAAACRTNSEFSNALDILFDHLLPEEESEQQKEQSLWEQLKQNGFDRIQHEQVRAELTVGRIGLAQNRLPTSTTIEDVPESDLAHWTEIKRDKDLGDRGEAALQNGEVAVVTLTAGVGSRWSHGAGIVKALNPFTRFSGVHRSFLETHIGKSRRTNQRLRHPIPHIFTTSYLTHQPIADFISRSNNFGYDGDLVLSEGRSIGLRMIPMTRDLRYAWEEVAQQRLDEQKEKVRESTRAALLKWAQDEGEGSDYTDNLPSQCMHPIGHWYEFSNLLRNGTLDRLITARPQLQYLFMHNIDTLGANLDPALLGYHIEEKAALTFEVIPRWFDDQGGGLARVNGRIQLLEGLAIPNEEDEFKLRFYNSNSNWIHIDRLLNLFGLTRRTLTDRKRVDEAVRRIAARMPTYVTLKDVKKRWGHGQEDIFPVAQFEKIWGDMTSLHEVPCRYMVVSRQRGQQLKDPAQLDSWFRDGTADYVESLCQW